MNVQVCNVQSCRPMLPTEPDASVRSKGPLCPPVLFSDVVCIEAASVSAFVSRCPSLLS